MEPQQKKQLQEKLQAKKTPYQASEVLNANQKRNFWVIASAIATIAFSSWAFFPVAAPDFDNISQQEINQIQSEFNAKGVLDVARITLPAEQLKAVESMALASDKEQELLKKINNNELSIAWVKAWDNSAEDGDWLGFSSAGYHATVALKKAPFVFALPLVPGQNAVKVTGVKDGGGGITATVITSTGAVSVPVIQTGQSYIMPLR